MDPPSSSSSSLSHSPPRHPQTAMDGSSNMPGNSDNVDRLLFNNLVEMVPLVETLMDRRGKSSFTRRASMVYTPAPPLRKKAEPKSCGKPIQTASAKKREEDREELDVLRGQVDELQKKLSQREESLKAAEASMLSAQAASDQLKGQIFEKDSLIRSARSQLSSAEIALADKQAALEKLEWENRVTSGKVEKLQGDLASADFEIGAFMRFFDGLSKNDPVSAPNEEMTDFGDFDRLAGIDVDETAIQEAMLDYEAALTFAKDNPSEETLALASEARMKLRSFVL